MGLIRTLTRLPALLFTLALAIGACNAPTARPLSASPAATGQPNAQVSGQVKGSGHTLRIYVAGESIERRNRFVAPPFRADGSLNSRGELDNDNDEYGWMIPLAQRLSLRAPGLKVEFVGADTWLDADDNPYSGSFPSSTPGRTSAISGTDIPSWLESRRAELTARTHCYDAAFAARGGNDFGNDDDQTYREQLKELVQLLAAGSSCQPAPRIYVTGHMPDDQRDQGTDSGDYLARQRQRFVTRVRQAVDELKVARPELKVQFVDLFTPFTANQPTRAFPQPGWFRDGQLDYDRIVRNDDRLHVRRQASIYAGEIAADAMVLTD